MISELETSLSTICMLATSSTLEGRTIAMQYDDNRVRFTHQRSRTTNNSSLVVVLRSMTWADELVLSSIKWDNTTKVSTNSIDTIGRECPVALHNKVCRISLNFISSIASNQTKRWNTKTVTSIFHIRDQKPCFGSQDEALKSSYYCMF